MVTSLETNLRKSFTEVRKEMSELKSKIADMDKEIGTILGKLSLIENLGFKK